VTAESSPGNKWLDDIRCMWIATSLQRGVCGCDSVEGTRARQRLHSARILSHALWLWREQGVGTLSVDERVYTARSGEGGSSRGLHVGRGMKANGMDTRMGRGVSVGHRGADGQRVQDVRARCAVL
jgi:hypothetical protein